MHSCLPARASAMEFNCLSDDTQVRTPAFRYIGNRGSNECFNSTTCIGTSYEPANALNHIIVSDKMSRAQVCRMRKAARDGAKACQASGTFAAITSCGTSRASLALRCTILRVAVAFASCLQGTQLACNGHAPSTTFVLNIGPEATWTSLQLTFKVPT